MRMLMVSLRGHARGENKDFRLHLVFVLSVNGR